jgi:hypothetical protein
VESIAVSAAGTVALTGYFGGSISFGGPTLNASGTVDAYVVQYDPGLVHAWSKQLGDAAAQVGYGVTIDAAGNVIAVGNFGGTTDFGGGPITEAGGGDIFVSKYNSSGMLQWAQKYGDSTSQTAYGVGVDAAGNVLVTGDINGVFDFGGGVLPAGGGSDMFLLKLTP